MEFWASSPTPSVRAQFPFREFKRKEKDHIDEKARMDGPVAASLTLLGLALGNATLLKRKKRFGMDIPIQESPLPSFSMIASDRLHVQLIVGQVKPSPLPPFHSDRTNSISK